MTIHITEDYHCPSSTCGRFYIPLSNNYCYACGVKNAPPEINYLSQCVASLKYNLDHYGSIIPPAWIELSKTDTVLRLIFWIFFSQRKDNNSNIQDYLKKTISKIAFEEKHEYLRSNILDLCIAISKELYP